MTAIRSVIFNFAFYLNLIAFLILGSPFYFTPRRCSMAALQLWARVSLVLLRIICGINFEIKHMEMVPKGAVLVASKHQSLFETFALLPLFDDPAIVLKRELTWIPLFGWFALKFKMINVNRTAQASAVRSMIAQSRAARDKGRQIIIFPEGTRRIPNAPPDYKPGVAALYRALDLPCIPVALNSGQCWPRRQFMRHPGTITIEFLTPIQPGLSRSDFMHKLQTSIETASTKLLRTNRL